MEFVHNAKKISKVSNIFWFCWFVCVGTTLFLVCTNFGTKTGAKILVTFSIAYLIGALWAYIHGHEGRIRFLVVVFTSSIMLFVTNAVLLVFLPAMNDNDLTIMRVAMAKQQGIPFDSRTKLQVLDAMERDGSVEGPLTTADHFLHFYADPITRPKLLPFGSLSKAVLLNCNENGVWETVHTDEFGFANEVGSENVGVDAVTLGDSFTEGACVSQEDTIAADLRKLGLGRVVNLGKSSSGPLIQLAIFREYAVPLHPKRVIWLFFENDFADLKEELRFRELTAYLNPSYTQHLRTRQGEIDGVLRTFVSAAQTQANASADSQVQTSTNDSLLRDLVSLRKIRLLLAPQEPADTLVETYATILRQTRTEVSTWGGVLTIVYLPSYESVKNDRINQKMYKAIKKITADEGIQLIDFRAKARSMSDSMTMFPFGLQGHYTREGYERVAKTIYQALDGSSPSSTMDTLN